MQYSIETNNQVEVFELDKVAKQSSGAVLYRNKDTVILASVARENKIVNEDFLPLTVQYIEKAYASGKIPGGYIKRETKPGEFETLSARIIDRSLRPLFPKGYAYPTQIVIMVLSADNEVDLQVAALNAASAALYLSDIGIDRSVCGLRVGYVDNRFVINPNNTELKNSSLDLYVAGTKDELLMIEMRSIANEDAMNEFKEEQIIDAIELASKAISRTSIAYEDKFKSHKKNSDNIELKTETDIDEIIDFISKNYELEVKNAINQMAKSERASGLDFISEKIFKEKEIWSLEDIYRAVSKYKKSIVRSQILDQGIRADGRSLDEVRPISILTNILPKAHGSALFTRGQTQALVVATLGTQSDAQMYDILTEKGPSFDKFMFNYNFPGFSVGEASPLKPPGRRELGHGNLAKRALAPSIDSKCPYIIRLVSEILESNGSSSMASVCGGSLALNAAGIKTHKLVAGVAMGLIVENNKHAILTDIMGLEDHDGDMDFKVAGSKDGITALQMDIKLGGISLNILSEALKQASEARIHILSIMQRALRDIRVNESILPKIENFLVDPSKIPDIIGQGGKIIKEIIEKYSVNIDLDRDKGEVKLSSDDYQRLQEAKEYILQLVSAKSFKKKFDKPKIKFNIGDSFDGLVKNILDFGAFIELQDGVDGLLHISQIKEKLNVGDRVRVVIKDQKANKISLVLE